MAKAAKKAVAKRVKVDMTPAKQADEDFDGLVQEAFDAAGDLWLMWEERGVTPKWDNDDDAYMANMAFVDCYLGERLG